MKTNFKGNTGEWYCVEHNWEETSIYAKVNGEDKYLCTLKIDSDVNEDTQHELEILVEENANVMADAGNVRQQINFDLPELLERYNEAVHLLDRYMKRFRDEDERYDFEQDTIRLLNKIQSDHEKISAK